MRRHVHCPPWAKGKGCGLTLSEEKSRVGNSLIGFSSDVLVFCERKSNLLVKKSESLQFLFCQEQPEPTAHDRSFVMNDLSELLTVALL